MAVHFELLQEFVHLPDLVHIRLAIHSSVGEHTEAVLLRYFDAFNGGLEDAVALYGEVMIFFHTVQVDVQHQAGMRLEILELLGDEHPVGAELNIFPTRENFSAKLGKFGIEKRLTAADGDHRRAALIYRRQALLEREPFT